MSPEPISTGGRAPSFRADTGMAWAVKDSFLRYVTASGGSIAVLDPAGMTAGSQFYFPLLDDSGFDPTRRTGAIRFTGSVIFTAHVGMLRIALKDPVLDISERAVLLADVDEGRELPIAEVRLPEPSDTGGIVMWRDARAFLLPESVALFGGTYRQGEELAPITVRVSVRPDGPSSD
jgi:hypothetical protein